MPRIAESQAADTSKMRRAPAQSPPPSYQSTQDMSYGSGTSPFMLSSLPTVASSGDLLQRQFYSGSRVPQSRILYPAARRSPSQ